LGQHRHKQRQGQRFVAAIESDFQHEPNQS